MSDGAIKPKIDDQYWFNYSETLVSNAQTKREKAAETLQKLVVWLWGIYTASAAVGFALAEKALPLWQTLLIASASASLIAVYWGTVWIQMPILVEFDPRSPTEISGAHKIGLDKKDKRLRLTVFLSILAAILVSLSIIFASVGKEHKILELGFEASIHATDEGRLLSLTGDVGKTKKVTVYVQPILSDSTSEKARMFILTPSEESLIQTSSGRILRE